MSHQALISIVERASTDAAFRGQLASRQESALAAYDLTVDERAALLSGDAGQLRALGVDLRSSKFGPTSPDEQDAWIDWLQGLNR